MESEQQAGSLRVGMLGGGAVVMAKVAGVVRVLGVADKKTSSLCRFVVCSFVVIRVVGSRIPE